jgi:hypothetical protein
MKEDDMNDYTYATDAEAGIVNAESLADAYDTLRSRITQEMIEDGATLWVEDIETGERITLGRDGE